MTILLKPVYRYLQKRSRDWSGSAALSTLLLALFLVMHQSVAAEAPKPQEPTAATTNSAETSAAPAETNATPAEASFKLDAYLNKKAIQTISASGQLEAFPELMLTADIQKAPLRKVLAVLAREAKLKVYVADNVPNSNISAKFDDLPLEEGLKQILKEQNYMLTRAELPSPPGTKIKPSVRLTEIRILPKRGEASGPYQLNEVASAPRDEDGKRKSELKKLVKQVLQADKAEDRLAALENFSKEAEETDDEWAEIEPTLKDDDERVRKAALRAMGGLGAPPLDSIADMARTDASPELRSSALSTLVEFTGENAIPQLNDALKDPDPTVRERAGELLEEANATGDFLRKHPLTQE